MTRRTILSVTAAASLTLVSGGCSDDITCPVLDPNDTLPYVSASVVQRADDREGSTHAEVVCTADPLPSLLITFINGRELTHVGPSGELSVRATLEDDMVVWQPGTPCSLEVTTDYGYATATAVVPGAVAVTAPAGISVGDTLTLTWNRAAGADYYLVSGVLAPVAGAPASGGRDTVALSVTTRDTFAVFTPQTVAFEGIAAGTVSAVSGPFPESGAAGNVNGDGWGFFTLRFTDAGSEFSVAVSGAGDTAPHLPGSR